uniref:Ribonuclease T2 n=1 Tax=Plectus sambesii TaxID=2011161 RepID=A0A914XQT0_9BILA
MINFMFISCFVFLLLSKAQGDDSFEFLMFAQQYPTSMCLVQDETGSKTCVVPKQANAWTVHGLWPSRYADEGPQFCHNPGRKFDHNKIQPIEDVLLQKWPNILPGQGEDSLWKHEWEKHGSCAEALPELGGELKYFQRSIGFHDQFDVFKTLNAAGITPSADKAYSNARIIEVLGPMVANNTIITHCVKDTDNDKWYIASIRLCIDKTFSPIKCGRQMEEDWEEDWRMNLEGKLPTLRDCPDGDIYYPPSDQTDRTIVAYQDVPRTVDAWEWLFQLTPIGYIWHSVTHS